MTDCRRWRPIWSTAGGRDCYGRHARDACRQGGNRDRPDRLQHRCRPGAVRPRGQPQPPRRQPHGRGDLSGDLAAKKLEVLHELLPDAAVVAMLVNPANPVVEPKSRATQDAARSLGVELHILRASTAGEIDAAFASLAKLRARALVVSDDSYFINQRAQIMALAARDAVPTISGWRAFPVAGGLMSYGTDLADAYRQVGLYAGKSLRASGPPIYRCNRS